ncbi:MAG: hypothetical protein ACREP7_08260 [Lysobacter sp.]
MRRVSWKSSRNPGRFRPLKNGGKGDLLLLLLAESSAPVPFEQFQAGRDAAQASAFTAQTEQATAQLLRLFNAEVRRQTGPVEPALVSTGLLNPLFEAPLPLGVRGEFEGRPVLIGQGTPGDHLALLSLMVGAHLIPADEFVVTKRKGEVPQR